MRKPRRNDPCPCGSGQKYKNCCGVSNVIEFNPSMYNKELEHLSHGLLEFTMNYFEAEIFEHSQHYFETFLKVNDKEAANNYLTLIMPWLIFRQPLENGQTIFDMYLAEQKNKIKYPRTRKVFETWASANQPDVYRIVAVEDRPDAIVTIRSITTQEEHNYVRGEETEEDINSLLIGTLLPYVNVDEFFLGMLYIPGVFQEEIFNFLDEMDINNEKIEKVYPKIVADTILRMESEPIEWREIRHELVAELFAKNMAEKGFDDEVIANGIMMWNMYCSENFPIIQKLETYAAALEYIVQTNFVEDSTITQAQLAKEYGTTAGTISANYRKILEGVSNYIAHQQLLEDE